MERREFVAGAGAVFAATAVEGWKVGRVHSKIPPVQQPLLGPEVFARRVGRLQQELVTRKLDLFIAAPSTNFQYFTGYNPGRSERLIALFIPAKGGPVVVCPSFEVERLKRNTAVADVRGWDEQDDPWKLVNKVLSELKPLHRRGEIALEQTFDYGSVVRLEDATGANWRTQSAQAITERLRSIKYPEEVALIRQAIAITQDSIAATFAALSPGLTERDVADRLSQEMRTRGAPGGGLVQFGPSSALPHGGPGGTKLARETVVLIDAGSQVGGYTSDITRTIWWGDQPPEEFKRVFNTVHDAQTAAMGFGQPFTTMCQEMDRTARKVIGDAGMGQFFTHRLGHGMGMDGHETPWLVEGNETRLEPGMVFTVEPGIYQVGKFGVRIEDDCLMTEHGIEVLSRRAEKL